MKAFHNCIFAILLFPFCGFAQPNYQPGLIVNLKGDTIKGSIDYKEWEGSPKSILFKPDGASAPQRLAPREIKFFSASVGHLAAFFSYAGRITTDNTNPYRAQTVRDTSFKIDTIFLRVLQDGPRLKLFSYQDDQKTRFFIARDFYAQPVELTYRLYHLNSTDENGLDRTVEETAFKGQLYDEAVKAGVMSASLKGYLSKCSYNEDDILYVTSIINGVSSSNTIATNRSKASPLRIVLVVAGVAAILYFVVHDFITVH